MHSEIVKLPIRQVNWDNSATVIAVAEQRLKDLNAVLKKLKDAVKSKN